MSITAAESATKQSQGDAITPEDVQTSGVSASDSVARYALSLADDSLILAQRLSEWVAWAPEMEEDIALTNIALDLVGHARFFYSYAGTAYGKSEDELAYFRSEEEFLSTRMVEQDNGDFGQTIARQLIYSYYLHALYTALLESSDETIRAIAAKAVKEVEYHVDHASQWLLRLGLGTEESQRRMQAGLDYMWAYVDEVFEDLDFHEQSAAVKPSTLKQPVISQLRAMIERAGLRLPETKQARSGSRTGRYSEHRSYILGEMQFLARQHPGATW